MLVVQDDVGRAVAHTSGSLRLAVAAVDFHFGKVRLDFAVAGAGVNVESGSLGHAEVDGAVAAVDLHITERAHGDFDAAVFILQTHVAGNIVQADLLGARAQVKRAGDLVGVQIVGVEIEISVNARKFEVGAGRLEGNALGDAR